jgi:two-component system CheB/CheR fusion protein
MEPTVTALRAELARVRALLEREKEERRIQGEELRVQQEQLIESQRQLEVSRDRYVDLYDFAPIAYVTLDANGLVEEINLTGARLLGLERARLVGAPFILRVAGEDRRGFLAHLAHARRTLTPGAQIAIELTLAPRGGGRVPAELWIRRAADDSRPVFRTAIVDLTERRRAEEARARALEERARAAEERQATRLAGEAKDRFLATLSHELRAPLTAIAFALASTRQLDDLPTRVQTTLDMMRRNLDLEARLIDDLLDVTRIQRGKLRLVPEVIDPHAVLDEVARMCAPAAEASQVALWLEPPDGAPFVKADPGRLRQAVWNLVTNALRHTPPEGRITLGAHPSGHDTLIEVRDTGSGIPAAALPRIFEPFEQGDAGTGLGLGLAIVKGIVESHGGHIDAESGGRDFGARFRIVLPGVRRKPARATRTAAPAAVNDSAATPARRAPCRILFAEDNEDSATAIAEFLRANGYEVLVANSVQSALERAAQSFDVVVSDLGLPDGTGHELMAQLRLARPVPGIALSGYGSERDVARALAAGFDVHLTKPVEPEALLAAIERVRPRSVA